MAKTKTLKGKTMEFRFKAPDAKEVMLAGDFNNWDYSRTRLKKDRNFEWKKALDLKPGRYEYKFIVDGNWVTDPNNSNRIVNAYGSENSVIEI